ncbi:MAG: hypothetical protein A2X46_17340 [Lentisphaerae bacterium GWF2_57_35]|nr:MAG: hypothetical protein A2X46_17340 [Lentisphaerae bacterium GWF2_57_35]
MTRVFFAVVCVGLLLPIGPSFSMSFSERPEESKCVLSLEMGAWCMNASDERSEALFSCTNNIDFYCGHENLFINRIKDVVQEMSDEFADSSQATNASFDEWFAATNIDLPRLTPERLINLGGLPASFFSNTELNGRDALQGEDGWAGVRTCMSNLTWVAYDNDVSISGYYEPESTYGTTECNLYESAEERAIGYRLFYDTYNKWRNEGKIFEDIIHELTSDTVPYSSHHGVLITADLEFESFIAMIPLDGIGDQGFVALAVVKGTRLSDGYAPASLPILLVNNIRPVSIDLYAYRGKLFGECFTSESLVEANRTNGVYKKYSVTQVSSNSYSVPSDIYRGCSIGSNTSFYIGEWVSPVKDAASTLRIASNNDCYEDSDGCPCLYFHSCCPDVLTNYTCSSGDVPEWDIAYEVNLYTCIDRDASDNLAQKGYYAVLKYDFEYK